MKINISHQLRASRFNVPASIFVFFVVTRRNELLSGCPALTSLFYRCKKIFSEIKIVNGSRRNIQGNIILTTGFFACSRLTFKKQPARNMNVGRWAQGQVSL